MASIEVRSLTPDDLGWARNLLVQKWRSPRIVRRGEVCYADEQPGFVAFQRKRRVGLVTYRIDGGECEIVTLNSLKERTGAGSSLVEKVKSIALSSKCRRLWLITTNDNTIALKFFQKKGFELSALYRNAIALSRTLSLRFPK